MVINTEAKIAIMKVATKLARSNRNVIRITEERKKTGGKLWDIRNVEDPNKIDKSTETKTEAMKNKLHKELIEALDYRNKLTEELVLTVIQKGI